jgi:hypothetical protein
MGEHYQSTFALGDMVDILRLLPRQAKRECDECRGEGALYKKDGTRIRECWRCHGKGYSKHNVVGNEWTVEHRNQEIGMVRVTMRNAVTSDDALVRYERVAEEEYMCQATGIGSGSVFKRLNVVAAGQGDTIAKQRNKINERTAYDAQGA